MTSFGHYWNQKRAGGVVTLFSGCGLALLLAVTLTGCDDESDGPNGYDSNLRYSLRQDAIVLQTPNATPPGPAPLGLLDESIAAFASSAGGKILVPKSLSVEQRDQLKQTLDTRFGTPAAPNAVPGLEYTAEQLAFGSRVYRKQCVQCHGLEGNGRGSTVGATDTDDAVVKLLRKSGKPVILVANKVDDPRIEADAAMLWSFGLGQPWPVSALHGRGSGDVLDAVLAVLPKFSAVGEAYARGGPRRVALVGRPNVGKSSLLNRLAGEDRVVVDNVPGTTRDPVDELIELGGKSWRFVDTAGIRRRVHQTRGADFYASLRTQTALERAEVAVVLIDAEQAIAEQDIRVVQQVVDAGRALVVAYNKWDTLDEERRHYLEREIEKELVQIPWAPRVNISALTGRHMDRLVPAIETALESWDTRVSTGRLNAFLGTVVAANPHPVRSGKQPRILFATQASTRPPRFVVFASGFLEAGYRRFIERRLREEFGFEGTPIEVSVRVREKRRK